MPKIRKKTSRRVGTHQREKVKKKVAEAKKKAKKAAKKDVTWKSNNKDKDLGIPSKFPFKDQILAEAAELKARREEEKQLRRERQKAAHQAASLGLPDPSIAALAESSNPYANLEDEDDGSEDYDSEGEDDDDDDSDDAGEASTSSSLRLHAKSLREVISKSDVIVQVLDARDPEGTRSRKIEREAVQVQGKKLVLVLNKIDLVPKENVEAWLKHLRYSFPTLPFKSSTQFQRRNLSSSGSSSASAHVPSGASSTSPAPLLTLLKNYSRAGSLTIGVIGFPNVGKSSLINTLKRSRACGVAPTPGFTKEIQIVSLDGSLKILDCPGVVYEGSDQKPESVLRNCTAVENVEDPIAPVDVMLRKCKKEHLMMLYNIPFFTETKDFLIAVARSRGRLKKGGIPDLAGAARMILRDWNAGRIPYYTVPPKTSSSRTGTNAPSTSTGSVSHPASSLATLMKTTDDIGSAAIVTEMAPEFDLDNLFREADSGALSDLKTSREMPAGSVVRLNESIKTMSVDQNGLSVDDVDDDGEEMHLLGEGDDDDDEDDMEEDVPMLVEVPSDSRQKAVGKKRQSQGNDIADDTVITLPPQLKSKRVTFDANPTSQKAKMFADTPEEAPLQLNKNIKLQAKKDKKKRAREARSAMQVERDDATMEAAPSTSALKKSKAAQPSSNGAPQPYDFSKFFGSNGGSSVVADEDEDM